MGAAAVRAGICARISSDREGDGLGVARQLEDCERLAELRGWQIAEQYVDDDVSAYSGKRRAAYARMLHDLRTGTINAVLVYHLDRLHARSRPAHPEFRCRFKGSTADAPRRPEPAAPGPRRPYRGRRGIPPRRVPVLAAHPSDHGPSESERSRPRLGDAPGRWTRRGVLSAQDADD